MSSPHPSNVGLTDAFVSKMTDVEFMWSGKLQWIDIISSVNTNHDDIFCPHTLVASSSSHAPASRIPSSDHDKWCMLIMSSLPLVAPADLLSDIASSLRVVVVHQRCIAPITMIRQGILVNALMNEMVGPSAQGRPRVMVWIQQE